MKDLKTLKSDIVRLRDEIAMLRREVAALKEPPPPRPPAELTPPDKGPDVTIRLPPHEDVACARAFIEEAWRRLMDMIGQLQKDMTGKGDFSPRSSRAGRLSSRSSRAAALLSATLHVDTVRVHRHHRQRRGFVATAEPATAFY